MNLKPILFSQSNASLYLNFQRFSKDLEKLIVVYPYPHPYPLHLQIQKTADWKYFFKKFQDSFKKPNLICHTLTTVYIAIPLYLQ